MRELGCVLNSQLSYVKWRAGVRSEVKVQIARLVDAQSDADESVQMETSGPSLHQQHHRILTLLLVFG
jgi:hypothetical protein